MEAAGASAASLANRAVLVSAREVHPAVSPAEGLATATIGKLTLGLVPLHMAGTLAPLVMFPLLTFNKFPFAPTMEGSTS